MNKKEFLESLHKSLKGLPNDEVNERIEFYSEMIDERIEEGTTETEAVSAIGNVDDISAQILSEVPLTKIIKEKVNPKRSLKAWNIILLIVGSPIWFSLLVAIFAVVLALYVSLWAVVISLWAVEISLAVCSVAALICGIFFIIGKNWLIGAAMISACLVLTGLTVFLFFGCLGASKAVVLMIKKCILGIKKIFIKKEIE